MPNARREEGLAHRHLHLPAIGERREQAPRIGFILGVEREREALEARLAAAVAVGGHQQRIADAERSQCMTFSAAPGGFVLGLGFSW